MNIEDEIKEDECFFCLETIDNKYPTYLDNIISCDCKIYIHDECFQEYQTRFTICPFCRTPITYFQYNECEDTPLILISMDSNQQNKIYFPREEPRDNSSKYACIFIIIFLVSITITFLLVDHFL